MFEECLLGVLSMVWCTFTRSYTRKGSTFSASLSWYAGRGSKNRNRSSPGDCCIPRCAHWGIPLFLPQAETRTSPFRRSGAALLPSGNGSAPRTGMARCRPVLGTKAICPGKSKGLRHWDRPAGDGSPAAKPEGSGPSLQGGTVPPRVDFP